MYGIEQFEPLWGVWRTEELIGEGSFGKVYRAVREEFGEKYYSAVKHISIPVSDSQITEAISEGISDDRDSIREYFESIAQNLVGEISLMNQIKGHTNIVSYEDHLIVPKASGIGYDIIIRMELLTGLNDMLRYKQFTNKDVIKLGIDICTALEVCIDKGIIHRDIKPSNIFISSLGDYKLGDFGVARQLEHTTAFMSKKGTYVYMAPEVYRGESANFSADTFSLGIVMYRLLNGNRAPFLPAGTERIKPGDNETALTRRMSGESFPAPAFADDDLAQVILKATRFDRTQRYSSPTELKEALLRLVDGVAPERSAPYTVAPPSGRNWTGGVSGRGGMEDNPDTTVAASVGYQTPTVAYGSERPSASGSRDYYGRPDAYQGAAAGGAAYRQGAAYRPYGGNNAAHGTAVAYGGMDRASKQTIIIIASVIAAAIVLVLGIWAIGNMPRNADTEVLADSSTTELVIWSDEVIDMDQLAGYQNLELITFEGEGRDIGEIAAIRRALPRCKLGGYASIYGKTVSLGTDFLDLSESAALDVAELDSYISCFDGLKDVDITGCDVDSDAAHQIEQKHMGDITLVWDITIADSTFRTDVTELDLSGKGVVDISELKYCTELTSLNLGANWSGDYRQENSIKDISQLAGLTNLTDLNLNYNEIIDISPLAGLTELKTLNLYKNSIQDITPLAGLTNLETLYLHYNKISSVSTLTKLTNLTYLNISHNILSSITPLLKMSYLDTLWAVECGLSKDEMRRLYSGLPNCDIHFK